MPIEQHLSHPVRLTRVRFRGAADPIPTTAWQDALAWDTKALLSLNAYHLTEFPQLAPAFADLIHELRFSDLGDDAKAAYVAEVLTILGTEGPAAARIQCLRAITQLEAEYAQRHKSSIVVGGQHD